MDRILLATDGSEEARPAAELAFVLARQLGASVLAVHVVEPQAAAFEMAPQQLIETIQESLLAEGRRVLSDAERHAKERAIPCETVLAEGNVAREVLRIAADRGVRMIVCGSHGHGAFARVLLGSVSTKLVHLSPIPVLIVPSRADAR